jgi:hypothetical protein
MPFVILEISICVSLPSWRPLMLTLQEDGRRGVCSGPLAPSWLDGFSQSPFHSLIQVSGIYCKPWPGSPWTLLLLGEKHSQANLVPWGCRLRDLGGTWEALSRARLILPGEVWELPQGKWHCIWPRSVRRCLVGGCGGKGNSKREGQCVQRPRGLEASSLSKEEHSGWKG